MIDKKQLESDIYRLKDQTSLKKLFIDLNYENADEPVNKENWNDLKESVMLNGLRCKFRQHPELSKLLLSTSSKRLVESTSSDMYWGESIEGIGQNRLGELLIMVRNELLE